MQLFCHIKTRVKEESKAHFLTESEQQIYYRVALPLTAIFCAANCKSYFVMGGKSGRLLTRRTAEHIPACSSVKVSCN